MAQRTVVHMIDDLTGQVGDDVSRTEFAIDGVVYEIDLNEENAARLNAALENYVAAARRVRRRATDASPGLTRREAKEVREWAKLNGHELSDRGRIPGTVIAGYRSATAA
ncbi:Lsr2 family protein [Allokutzneria sp. NRRL B-24872]|uniref:histone-like nucleoid-structuring protein Lsr2 n=1 Tax=Allokutzneria sp. NRRL B-24872 TaxID=1137961 RepID=UPI000A387D0F|nr:Lsr2 family protein [Allokutzneria sp. NRRL B-24872]